jgi:hypothetical protein
VPYGGEKAIGRDNKRGTEQEREREREMVREKVKLGKRNVEQWL